MKFYPSIRADRNTLSSFPKVVVFDSAWNNCVQLTSFPPLSSPRGISFNRTWQHCDSLALFPPITCLSGVEFNYAWEGCDNLRTFPNTTVIPVATSFQYAWSNCTRLTSFPTLCSLRGIDFSNAWSGCTNLSYFSGGPNPDLFSPTILNSAWSNCTRLTSFSFNVSTFAKMISGQDCFRNVTLPVSTWSVMLTSISATNFNLNVRFSGGNSKRTSSGTNAYNYLQNSRGWVITDGGQV
jgi:hypothetical protein